MSEENVNNDETIILNYRMRRVRGRKDSVSLTLPPSWVRDVGISPIGKCFLNVHMDSKKRLVLTPLDIIDSAEPKKRVVKQQEQPITSEQNYSENQETVVQETETTDQTYEENNYETNDESYPG